MAEFMFPNVTYRATVYRTGGTWHGANPSRDTVLCEGFSLTKFESRPFKRNSSTPCPFPQMSQNYVHLLESVKDLNFRLGIHTKLQLGPLIKNYENCFISRGETSFINDTKTDMKKLRSIFDQ